MTQEEKRLLLIKDLCARLPYHLRIHIYNDGWEGCRRGEFDNIMRFHHVEAFLCDRIEILPYLRPMSSMTEEEKKIIRSYGFELIPYDTGYTGFANIENCIDEVSFRFMEEFLNAHHFDYRGLIPMGLALEAHEEMYKAEWL